MDGVSIPACGEGARGPKSGSTNLGLDVFVSHGTQEAAYPMQGFQGSNNPNGAKDKESVS